SIDPGRLHVRGRLAWLTIRTTAAALRATSVQALRDKAMAACKVVEQMLLVGSGVVGRRTFKDAAIGDQAVVELLVPGRPSSNAALRETMTSTAPHLLVRTPVRDRCRRSRDRRFRHPV